MIRVEVEDSGEYICTAINVLGNQTASANVTVQSKKKCYWFCFAISGIEFLIRCIAY